MTAKIVWETADEIWCQRVQKPAQLLEERVYLSEHLPEAGAPFQVRARKCSFGTECNLDEYACRWSYINPTYDPFSDKPALK